jgi:formylglycine-generating enzyme required for sulfatase activity
MLPATPQLTIQQRQGRNQYYDEILAAGVLPLRMMLIPAGTFTMGSPEDELERSVSEGPAHPVRLAQFFMAKYPVTQAQWQVVANLPRVEQELNPDPSGFKGERHPVEQVSWHEAVEFCDRLTLHTNRQYRLPSEAEWEYACRAGTTTPFHFGATLSTDYANYDGADQTDGAYGPGTRRKYRLATTPVDQFGVANAFGLCDMHGNVFEWCYDHWHKTYQNAPIDGSAWLSSDQNSLRVIRGGSWNSAQEECRSGFRTNDYPNDQFNGLGFRIVCSGSKSSQA